MNQFFSAAPSSGPSDRRGVVGHGDWWVAFEPRFHHATFVFATAFAGVLVSEMRTSTRVIRVPKRFRALPRPSRNHWCVAADLVAMYGMLWSVLIWICILHLDLSRDRALRRAC